MYSEKQLIQMDIKELKLLLASGLHGNQYKLVMKVYRNKVTKMVR